MVTMVRPNEGRGSDLVTVITWNGTHMVIDVFNTFSASTIHSVTRLRPWPRRSTSSSSFFLYPVHNASIFMH